MRFTTRFAPSPTGRLHLGHAYSALLAHDASRVGRRRLPPPHRRHRHHALPPRIRGRHLRGSRLARPRLAHARASPVRSLRRLRRRHREAAQPRRPLSLLPHAPRNRGAGSLRAACAGRRRGRHCLRRTCPTDEHRRRAGAPCAWRFFRVAFVAQIFTGPARRRIPATGFRRAR